MGIYFIYLGAVLGSSGLISCFATASFISLEILAELESLKPNLLLNELLVSCSPSTF